MKQASQMKQQRFAGITFADNWTLRLDIERYTYSLCRPDGSPVAISVPEKDAAAIAHLIKFGSENPGRRDSRKRGAL